MDQLWHKYQDYKTQNETYLQEAYVDGQYYLGNQYTEEELRKLQARGQAPSVVNYAYATVYTQMSIMGAKSPEFRAIARDDNDVKKTKLVNDVLAYIYHISDGDLHVRDAMESMLIFGRGNLGACYDPLADDGMGEVKFESIPIDEVYYDPRAKDRFGRDSEYIFRKKLVAEKHALEAYPDYKELIVKAAHFGNKDDQLNQRPSQNGTLMGTGQMQTQDGKEIEIIEAYCKKSKIMYRFFDQNGQQIAEVDEAEAEQTMAELQGQAAKVIKIRKRYIQMSLLFGSETAVTYDLPISDYPIVPLCNMWSGNLFPFGDIRQLRGLNDEINKLRSLRIQHMATAINGKMIAKKGLFDKENQVEQNLARPGAVLTINPMSDDINKDITFLQSAPVSADNYNHEQITKQDIQGVSGIYEMMQGGSAGAPDTFRATLAFDEFGQRKLRYKLKNVEMALGQLGKVVLEWAQKAYPVAKTIRVVEPEWNSEEEQVRYQQINVPIFDTYGDLVNKFNDLSIGKYDVIVRGGSTMPSNRWSEQQAYKEDLQLGIIDDIEYIKKTDIYDRQGLLERKSLYVQQKQQIDQMAEQLEELNDTAMQLDQKLLQERKDAEVMKARYEELIRQLKDQMNNDLTEQKTKVRMEKAYNEFKNELDQLKNQEKNKQR